MILMDNFSLKFDKHNIFPCSELLCFIQVYYIGTSCLVSMLCPFSKLLSAWNKLSLDLSWPQAVRHEADQDFLPFRLWRWTVLFQMMQHVPLIFILYINIILSFCPPWLQSKAKCNKVNICYVMRYVLTWRVRTNVSLRSWTRRFSGLQPVYYKNVTA